MSDFYDHRRGIQLRLTPEERVRLSVLEALENELGYPKHLIAIERGLKEISKDDTAPNRRIDILAFEEGTLAPLLLIECKAVPLKDSMLDQVLGYNHFAKARSVCLVNETQCIVGVNKGGSYSYQHAIPTYTELTTRAFSDN